jgi:hypothetical protein
MLSYLGGADVAGAIATIERGGSGTIAAALRANDYIYPFFGDRRERTVLLVEHEGGDVPRSATWLVMAPGASVESCGRWEHEYAQNGWLVERRLDSSSSPCIGLQTTP